MLMARMMLCALLGTATSGFVSAQPEVRVEAPDIQSARPLLKHTADAAVRNYLQSWQSLQSALYQNRAELLDAGFVGNAKEKLAKTIQQQTAVGIHTRYTDRSHDLQIVAYSPEGLSIELTDDAEYDVEVFDHDTPKATQRVHARYLAVLTPSESRWRVRVFQAEPQ